MIFTKDEIRYLRQKHNHKDSKEFYQELNNLTKLIKDNHKQLLERIKDEERLRKHAEQIFKDDFKQLH